MTRKISKNPSSPPSKESFKTQQLSLFQSFLANGEEDRQRYSNTIELWDSLPKYTATQQGMNQRRSEDGLLKPIVRQCHYKNTDCKITINAAVLSRRGIKGEDDAVFKNADREREYKAFYPSANEEIIEECLRKLAAEQQMGFFEHEDDLLAAGVQFSLHMLRKELKKRGHTRSYYEIIKSIRILMGSQISIEQSDGSGEINSNYLPVVYRVSKSKLADDPEAKWFVKFHPLVTQSIRLLTYRQYDYELTMSLKSQLSRWLNKRLAHNFINAGYGTSYTILFSTVKRDSGLLEDKRVRAAKVKLEEAFEELKNKQVLITCEKDELRGLRNKIEDVKYKLTPHPQFIKGIKIANKRAIQVNS